MPIDLTPYTKQATLKLTTTGRKSGRQYTVTIWFVVVDAQRCYVQHVRGKADWYKNLVKNPAVQVDFGAGPTPARATPIADPAEVRHVLALFRRKYWAAYLVQLLGITKQPVAATIQI
jgi:deazaflavin-dependent oxidoreductase (nitroreductase family)